MNPDAVQRNIDEYVLMLKELKETNPEKYEQFLTDLLPLLREMESALKASLDAQRT